LRFWDASAIVPLLVAEPAGVKAQALRLLRAHSLRAADSLQLSAALAWCERDSREAAFVCLDDRLRVAAETSGFRVLP
jgi:hypothetical protein